MGITHTWNGLISEFTLDNTFSFPKDWLLNIQGYIKPAHETGCSQRKALGDINFRLSRQFLKDKSLSVAILANDILHTRYTEMTAYGGINVRTHFREYRDSRRIGIMSHVTCYMLHVTSYPPTAATKVATQDRANATDCNLFLVRAVTFLCADTALFLTSCRSDNSEDRVRKAHSLKNRLR